MDNNKVSHDARANFGFKGWWIIIFAALNWFFYGGLVNSSMNTVVPQLAGKMGVEPGVLLSYGTLATCIALVVCLFIGKIASKVGVRLVNGICLILGAIFVFFWGQANTVAAYVIVLILMVTFLRGVQLLGGNQTITNWFPKKKGIAIGFATMGLNISSACFVAILTGLSAAWGGIQYALYFMAGCLIVLAIINFVAFRNFPEEWNAFPDNDPNAVRKATGKVETGWTTGKVLAQKETWFIGITNGFYGMTTVGFVSTLIPTLLMKGFTQPQALTMMTVASLIGLVGSYLCGFIDQKFGSKKSSIIYGIWVIIAMAFFFVPGPVGAWIWLVMMGLSIGGSNNYPPSMTAQIFGRDGAANAFPIVFFISGIIGSLCYLLLGQSQALTGTYNMGWLIFIGLVIVGVVLLFFTNMEPKDDPLAKKNEE